MSKKRASKNEPLKFDELAQHLKPQKRCQEEFFGAGSGVGWVLGTGRLPRITESGLVFHVLTRRVMRLPLFTKDEDYLALERVPGEWLARSPFVPGTTGKLSLAHDTHFRSVNGH